MNDFTYSLDLHYDINSVKEAEEKLKELTDIRRRLERSIGEYKERRVKQFRITHRQGMLHDRTITFRQEGAIKTGAGKGYYKYFIPLYSIKERIQDNRRHMAKHQAFLAALSSAKADIGCAKAPDTFWVVVTASYGDIELGSASCGDVERDQINYMVNHELAQEAVEEAKKNLANLLDKIRQVS